MKKIVLISLAFLLSACGKSSDTEYYYDNHPHQAFSYRSWDSQSFPLHIQVPASMQTYEDQIIRAGETWNEALGQTVFIFHFGTIENTQWTKPNDPLKDGFFGLFQQINWVFAEIGSGVLAYTSSLSQNNQILHADIIFNFDNFNFADHDFPPTELNGNYIDFESVLVHELGHFLGLGHMKIDEDPSSVMLPTLGKGAARRQLSEGDMQRVRSIYLRL